jgi:hydroxymethylglutaryl-CoA lyase
MDKQCVEINEVGLRDGLQNQNTAISTEQKLKLAEKLLAANIQFLEATSFVHPKAVPQMADNEAVLKGLRSISANEKLCTTVLVPNMRGYENAMKNNCESIAIVLATTDSFNEKNLNMTLAETRAVCVDLVKQSKLDGIKVRAYISGACACPYDGKQPVSIVKELVDEMVEAGASEISVADTTGAGSPAQINEIFEVLLKDYSAELFNVHLHDTRGQALAMAWEAVRMGIRKFDSSIAGLGGCPFAPGAKGNVATEDLVYMLHSSGFETGIEFSKLFAAIEVAEEITQSKLGGKIMPWVKTQQEKGRDISL